MDDPRRCGYLRTRIAAIGDAIERGVDVRGYMVWSLLDNLEWSLGFSKRFGIVHVDYDTQARTPKRSARFYSNIIRTKGVNKIGRATRRERVCQYVYISVVAV